MSILETFYILFKGDNADVKQKAKETEHVAQNLQDALTGTFRKIDKESAKVGRSFMELAQAAATFIGASTAIYSVFHKTLSASNFAAELGTTARVLRVNVADLDAWGQAVTRAGGSAAGFQQSLKNLSQHFGASATTSLKILPQLADVFQRLGSYRAQYYGKLLGLDEGTILLLQQGRREVEGVINRLKEIGAVTQKDVEIANKYKIANLELSLAFRGLYLSIAQTVIPILTKVYEKITPIIEYLRQHKDFVIGTFIGIGVAAGIMLAPFIIASLPILATVAALTLLVGVIALAYDDIKNYIEGHNSLIGLLSKRWSNFKTLFTDIFKSIRKVLEWAFSPIYGAIAAAEKLLSMVPGFSGIKSNLENGQTLFDVINQTPVATAPANMFTQRSFNRNATINTGDLIVNTQATDAAGISKSLTTELNKHFWQTSNQMADGVAY